MKFMEYNDKVFSIPGIVVISIFIRILVIILLTLYLCVAASYESYAKNVYIPEIITFFVLVGPYLIVGLLLYFNKKWGMKCLVIVSVFEFLLDMSSLIFKFQVFWGTTFISYVAIASGYLNTPFSSITFLYFGTKWSRTADSLLTMDGIHLDDNNRKWYQQKRDILVRMLVIVFGICAYYSCYFKGLGHIELFALLILFDGMLIGLKHYWILIVITLAMILIIGIYEEMMLIWGACIFSVAVLLYVVRKNIEKR